MIRDLLLEVLVCFKAMQIILLIHVNEPEKMFKNENVHASFLSNPRDLLCLFVHVKYFCKFRQHSVYGLLEVTPVL